MSDPRLDFSETVRNEFLNLFAGVLLGEGIHRKVFAHALDPKMVIKVEDRARTFANVHEWQVWEEAPDAARRWLAPCHYISHSGSVLIQARTQPIKKLPAELPNFLTDLKPDNFGRLRGKIVAHDYGYSKVMSRGLVGWRLKKVAA